MFWNYFSVKLKDQKRRNHTLHIAWAHAAIYSVRRRRPKLHSTTTATTTQHSQGTAQRMPLKKLPHSLTPHLEQNISWFVVLVVMSAATSSIPWWEREEKKTKRAAKRTHSIWHRTSWLQKKNEWNQCQQVMPMVHENHMLLDKDYVDHTTMERKQTNSNEVNHMEFPASHSEVHVTQQAPKTYVRCAVLLQGWIVANSRVSANNLPEENQGYKTNKTQTNQHNNYGS